MNNNELRSMRQELEHAKRQIAQNEEYAQNVARILVQITSAKTFRAWQYYNKVKKFVIKIVSHLQLLLKDLKTLILYGLREFIDNLQLFSSHKHVNIVIPVYNAVDDLKRCVHSVLSNTTQPHTLIIIDDKSTDPQVSIFLDFLQKKNFSHVKIIKNVHNLGFVKTVNQVLKTTKTDVILLNSDTIVTKRWLSKLTSIAESRKNIATITPFSNNAAIHSIPSIGELKEQITPELINAVLEENAEKFFGSSSIEIPTGIGFCLYIKKKAIDACGIFDEIYGAGYNEENDFCQRATQMGYVNLLAVNTFVYHKSKASFVNKQEGLELKNSAILLSRYPDYLHKVYDFNSNGLIQAFKQFLLSKYDAERKRTIVYETDIFKDALECANAFAGYNIILITNKVEFISLTLKVNNLFFFFADPEFNMLVENLQGDLLIKTKSIKIEKELIMPRIFKKFIIILTPDMQKESLYHLTKSKFQAYLKLADAVLIKKVEFLYQVQAMFKLNKDAVRVMSERAIRDIKVVLKG